MPPPAPAPTPAPAEKSAAAPRLTLAPTLSDTPALKRRLAAPLAPAMAREARGSPALRAASAALAPGGSCTGSARGSRSARGAGLRLLWNSTSWLASVRLMLDRSGTPLAEKKSSVSLNCSTTPLKL